MRRQYEPLLSRKKEMDYIDAYTELYLFCLMKPEIKRKEINCMRRFSSQEKGINNFMGILERCTQLSSCETIRLTEAEKAFLFFKMIL